MHADGRTDRQKNRRGEGKRSLFFAIMRACLKMCFSIRYPTFYCHSFKADGF